MSTERTLISRWFYRNEWGYRSAPPPHQVASFCKALVRCASGDGQLAPEEREWIAGYLACAGVEEGALEALLAEAVSEDIGALLAQSKMGDIARRAIVFDALRACYADGDLQAGERAAVVQLADALGVPAGTVQALEGAYLDERAARQRRLALVYPNGAPF